MVLDGEISVFLRGTKATYMKVLKLLRMLNQWCRVGFRNGQRMVEVVTYKWISGEMAQKQVRLGQVDH